MLVATLGVVEYESPVIFETMQPKAKVAMTVCAPQSADTAVFVTVVTCNATNRPSRSKA